MATGSVCGECGAPLTAVGHEQLCPGCLLEGGLASAAEAQMAPDPSQIANPKSQIESLFPRAFGDYELLEEIARGGMGIVYKARQASLDRLVAVKMLLFGPLAKPEFVQRFRTEAAAAASLQHPNIVAIHEVGYRDGQHFFAMDYVEGLTLAQLVAKGPLPARRAAGCVKTIAEAIHFAHERNILHRDLKPSNVLIDAATEQPRVTDFGLAKRLDKDTELTLSGHVLGSPNYMPPEQAAAHRGLAGKRSDVYSLGAILYHLLTGRAPFAAETVTETLQLVQNSDPVSPRALNPSAPRDLETICLKCLEKEPVRRYQTAQALAEDLGRFMRGEPIQARPVSQLERVWRWARRNPMIATLATAVVLLAVTGFAAVLWQWLRAEHNSAEARAQRDLAQGRLYAAQMKQAHVDYRAGKIGGALERLRAWEPSLGGPDFRGFEWRWLQRLCSANSGEVLATNATGFSAVDVSSVNQTIALGASDGTVRLVDSRSGTMLTSWQAHPAGIDSVTFVPRRPELLVTAGGDDGLLKIWNTPNARLLFSTNCSKGMFLRVAISSSGRLVAAGAADWQIDERVGDRSTGTRGFTRIDLASEFARRRTSRVLTRRTHVGFLQRIPNRAR